MVVIEDGISLFYVHRPMTLTVDDVEIIKSTDIKFYTRSERPGMLASLPTEDFYRIFLNLGRRVFVISPKQEDVLYLKFFGIFLESCPFI